MDSGFKTKGVAEAPGSPSDRSQLVFRWAR